jgi:hypothetical protein
MGAGLGRSLTSCETTAARVKDHPALRSVLFAELLQPSPETVCVGKEQRPVDSNHHEARDGVEPFSALDRVVRAGTWVTARSRSRTCTRPRSRFGGAPGLMDVIGDDAVFETVADAVDATAGDQAVDALTTPA